MSTWRYDEIEKHDDLWDDVHYCDFCGKLMYLKDDLDGENEYVTMGGYHEIEWLYCCHRCINEHYPSDVAALQPKET